MDSDKENVKILILKMHMNPDGALDFEQYVEMMIKNTYENIDPWTLYFEEIL